MTLCRWTIDIAWLILLLSPAAATVGAVCYVIAHPVAWVIGIFLLLIGAAWCVLFSSVGPDFDGGPLWLTFEGLRLDVYAEIDRGTVTLAASFGPLSALLNSFPRPLYVVRTSRTGTEYQLQVELRDLSGPHYHAVFERVHPKIIANLESWAESAQGSEQ